MATDVLAETKSDYFQRIAAPLHTAFILGLQGLLSYLGKIHTEHQRAAGTLDRMRVYEQTIFFEWLVLALVLAGVWLHGSPIAAVLGERWRSMRQVFLDFGIAFVFLVLSIAVMSIFGAHSNAPDPNVGVLMPHGGVEKAVWIALALTAGICEEALFRGYLQRQFMAFTKNAALGILLAAAAFGAAHSYQGFTHALQIGLLGAMLGGLAYWRKTVRPGMISHVAQDVLAIFVNH